MTNQSFMPILLLGFLGTVLGIVFLTWISVNFGFSPLNYWVNLIIPIGAVVCGTLCALGFGMSARFIGYSATDTLYRVMLASGVFAFIALLLALYFAELAKFGLPNDFINFRDYIANTFSNGKMVWNHGSSKDEFDIGLFGLFFGIGKFAGFVSGYGLVYSATRYREGIAASSASGLSP